MKKSQRGGRKTIDFIKMNEVKHAKFCNSDSEAKNRFWHSTAKELINDEMIVTQ